MDRADAAHIAELFDRHFDTVYAYVAYRLAPRREAVADLSQDVFAAALHGLPRVRDRGAARSWLLAIARNKVADHLRARGRLEAVAMDEDRLRVEPAAPDERMARCERSLLVARVLSELPERQRELLEDKYIREMSVRAIAKASGATEKAVESALSRARNSFLDAMNTHRGKTESTR